MEAAGWWRRPRITLPGLKGIGRAVLILNLGYALTFGFDQMLIGRGAIGAQRIRGDHHIGLLVRPLRATSVTARRPACSSASPR